MIRYWSALFGAVLLSAISQILLKMGAKKPHRNWIREYANPWVFSGYILLVISTLCVIYAYRGVDYKNGPVIESFGYILVMLLGRVVFQEKITKKKLLGNLLILAGIIVFYL